MNAVNTWCEVVKIISFMFVLVSQTTMVD